MAFKMSALRRQERPSAPKYGATRGLMSDDQDVFDAPMDSINTLRNQEESDGEFSCSDFCRKGALMHDHLLSKHGTSVLLF